MCVWICPSLDDRILGRGGNVIAGQVFEIFCIVGCSVDFAISASAGININSMPYIRRFQVNVNFR